LQQLELGHGHVDDLLDRVADGFERLQEPHLARQVLLDRLFDASVEEAGVPGGVEER
jgi:hypothetical protein